MTTASSTATSGPPEHSEPAPRAPRTRLGPQWVVAVLIACVAASIWGVAQADAEPVATPAAPASATPVDIRLCADLDRLGRDFYASYYVPLSRTGGYGSGDYIRLAASTAAVSTVGAPSGQIDGSATIALASQPIASAMTNMVGASKALAQEAVDGALYGNRIPSVGPTLSAFGRASSECASIGRAPSWLTPGSVPG